MDKVTNNKSLGGLGEVLRISGPASMSMLNRTVTQFVDGAMVARLGPATITAQTIGGLVAFVPESFSIGLLGVVNTFVSQNLGAGRQRSCGQYAWAGLAMAMVLAAVFMPLAAVARPLFAAIGHAADIQDLEVLYFRYMILAVPLTMSIRVLEAFFYGTHRPGIVFTLSLIANLCNVAGNYVLIFGKFGFPAMGLRGAAIASIASWVLHLTILLSIFLSGRIHRGFSTRMVRSMRLQQCADILRIGWPAGVCILVDLLSWAVLTTVLVGHFGTEHMTAASAAVRYISLSFMPAIGVGIATTALVGRYIGQGRPELARRRAHTALLTAMVYMGLCGIAFLVFREPMIRLFVHVSQEQIASKGLDPEEIVRIGGRIMVCAAVFQVFDAMGIVFLGALRGAGDTRWPMVIMLLLNAVVLIGGGIAMIVFLPQLESVGPYLAATAYLIALGVVLAWRFESGAWRKFDLLGKRSAGQADPTGEDKVP